MSRFKVGDRVRITKQYANMATVYEGDEGVIIGQTPSGSYQFRPDIWRIGAPDENDVWYIKENNLELAEPKPEEKPEDAGLPEKIERMEKQIADLREGHTIRSDMIRKLRAEIAQVTKERNALADTLAAIRQEQQS